MQGNFTNPVLLRMLLPDDPSFVEVLSLTRRTVLDALARPVPRDVLDKLVGAPIPPPPVRIGYLANQSHQYGVLDTKPSGATWKEDAVWAAWPIDLGFAEDVHERVSVWASYDATKYSHQATERLIASFGEVLRRLAIDPSLACSDLARVAVS